MEYLEFTNMVSGLRERHSCSAECDFNSQAKYTSVSGSNHHINTTLRRSVLFHRNASSFLVRSDKKKRQCTRVPNAYDGPTASELSTRFPGSLAFHMPAYLSSTVQTLEAETHVSQPGLLTEAESFRVIGGCKLSGHVHISGAKNSALAVLAGTLCTSEDIRLRMVPELLDIQRMVQVLRSLGVNVRQCCSDVYINARDVISAEPCVDTVQKLRASFFVIGALVARYGEAVLALPGGCDIGVRPVDIHLRGLEALGANVELRQGKVHAWIQRGKRLKGGKFHFDFPSVGATETLMMAACLADGETVLSNAAQEPEVVDLARFLISCGAKIQGAGTNELIIKGVKALHGTDFAIIPDRVEAGTFLIAAAITRSTISLSPVVPCHLTSVLDKLRSIGCEIFEQHNKTLLISPSSHLRSLEVTTAPYPGFPTDLQPQLMSLLTTCHGESIVKETVFERRMGHVRELRKLGAKIIAYRSEAVISGKNVGSFLVGSTVKALDLRAGAALVLAGLAAEGISHIEGANHIDRGYDRLDEKLRLLGANIKRLS